jgi:hypothetical protein
LGFASEGRREHFVVLQSDAFALETAVVAPLDDHGKLYDDDPLVIEISAKEAGARSTQAVLVAHLTSVLLDRFEPGVVGRLRRASLMRVEDAIVRLFELSDAL